MADRLIMANNSQARRQSPSAANAITVQIAACVYCPLFTDAWNVTFDVSGIDRGFIERRIEKLIQPAIASDQIGSTASIARRERAFRIDGD